MDLYKLKTITPITKFFPKKFIFFLVWKVKENREKIDFNEGRVSANYVYNTQL